MAYLNIADFKFGMDRRRPRSAGIPGTLWNIQNAFISRGGDVVRAKKFVSKYSLPTGTVGLAQVRSQIYVFGSGANPGVPHGVQYVRLASPVGANLVRILDAKPANGKIYVIGEYDDGNVYHFYDGARVTAWDTIGNANCDANSVAAVLALKCSADTTLIAEAVGADVRITARVPGTPFTISSGATSPTVFGPTPAAPRVQLNANVPAVAETRATGTVSVDSGTAAPGANYFSQVSVNGVNLMTVNVDWVTSNSQTAANLASAIANNATDTGYTAAAVGNVVTITAAAGTGATPNGYPVAVTKSGNVTASATAMAHGATAVAAQAEVYKVTVTGFTDSSCEWHIILNGVTYQVTGLASGTGRSVFVHQKRVWSTILNGLLYYSVLNNFTDWTTTAVVATDSGFINISTDSDGSQRLVGCSRYNNQVALFADQNIVVYTLDTDANNNAFQQTLENTGSATGGLGLCSYGNTDVFYLDPTGIRSVRSRDGYNAGYVSDIGSVVDSFVQDWVASVGAYAVSNATAVIEPGDARYLLAVAGRIFALSYFPTVKITAWSYIEPGFNIDALVRAGQRLYARSGNTIYLYGGDNGDQYPDDGEQNIVVETPFMSANDPAGWKQLTAVDVSCVNDWTMDVLIDPNDETLKVSAGTINGFTYSGQPATNIPGETSHIAVRLTCSTGGYASFSSLAIHFDKLK